jgi:hypothetical protein
MADLHFRSFARPLLLLGVLAAASTLVLVPAAATYTGGTCNLSGVTANSVCFFKTYPRTSDNGQFPASEGLTTPARGSRATSWLPERTIRRRGTEPVRWTYRAGSMGST